MPEVNLDRMVQHFCELVKIPSESPKDEEFVSHMETVWKKMGASTKKDTYGNLVAKFPAKNSSGKDPIAFVAHADTVEPGIGIEPVIKDGIISSKGETILAGDNKAAVAEMTELLLAAEKHPPIEIILTRCEEIGTLGAINMDYSMIDSKVAYVVDTNRANEVIIGGPTLIIFNVEYTGKPAHSGIAPENGISAVIAASKAISRMKLGKLDDESSANIGVFNGGNLRNVIPEKAVLVGECRSLKHEKALAIADEMERIFKEASDEVGTQVKVEQDLSLKAYLLKEDDPAVKNFISALKKNDIKPDIKVTRGGSDATILNENGIASVVIGAGYMDAHSCREYVVVDDMLSICKVMKTMVEDLA